MLYSQKRISTLLLCYVWSIYKCHFVKFLYVLFIHSFVVFVSNPFIVFSLNYCDETCKQCIPSDQQYRDEASEMWAPLHAYKKSLSTDGEPGTTTPSHARGRRGKDSKSARVPRVSPHRKKRRTDKGKTLTACRQVHSQVPRAPYPEVPDCAPST